jgi:hypothetical protein
MNFIVVSPNYELLRFGHDLIQKQTTDAHTAGKYLKLIIGTSDLINPNNPPTPDNFRFEPCQFESADIVIYIDKNRKSITLKDLNLISH